MMTIRFFLHLDRIVKRNGFVVIMIIIRILLHERLVVLLMLVILSVN